MVGGGGTYADENDQTVEFREVQTAQVNFQVTDGRISTLALSPDGGVLLACYGRIRTGFSGGQAAPIRLWEVK